MIKTLTIVLFLNLITTMSAYAASSGPRLAGYYNRFLALCEGTVFEWNGSDSPVKLISEITQVGVGKNNSYALSKQGELFAWGDNPDKKIILTDQVSSFHAGKSAVFAIRNDKTLWQFNTKSLLGFGENISVKSKKIADNILTASVGDSANYYVTNEGKLFVHGLAHRGQYGDGKLSSSKNYVHTASDVIQVISHTGHTLILKKNGSVLGTGGNIYGPLGNHGYGDKAIKWGVILEDVKEIATGSSHSLAIKRDGSLWTWGRNEGLEPKQIMNSAQVVAAGSSSSIALSNDMLWQWSPGSKPKAVMKCKA